MRHLVLLLLLAGAPGSLAKPVPDAGASAPAKTGGEVDWKENVLRATGAGAPDLKAANPAQARLAAERAAQLDAFRNLLAQAKGVQVSSEKKLSDLLGESDEIKAKVEGTLRGFRVVKKRYFSDSGVELDVEVPLSVLVEALPSPTKPNAKTLELLQKQGKHTSLVIDATGLGLVPALEPRILDGKGGVVFGAELVGDEAFKDGVAHYARSVDEAKKSKWAGDKPLVVKAAKAEGSDLVLADADAKSAMEGGLAHLHQGRVVIVAP